MQAARGASLNPSDTVDHGPSRRRLAHASGVRGDRPAGLRRSTSARSSGRCRALVDGDKPLVGDWFTLHLTFNPGAAFSTGTGFTIVFTGLAMVAVVVVLWLSRRVRSTGWALALGLLLGGVSGNLTDRFVREPEPFHGHVVDFLMLPNWPVFNIADICINVAAGLIILQTFRGVALDGSRDADRRRARPLDAADGLSHR